MIERNFKVKLTDWGIAYAYGNLKDGVIEINRVLLNDPEALKEIMKHEVEHLTHPSFLYTVKIEFKDFLDLRRQLILFRFLLKYPKPLFQTLAPVWYYKKEISYNMFLIVFYLLILMIFMYW